MVLDYDLSGIDGEEFIVRARHRGYDSLMLVLSADSRAEGRSTCLGVPLMPKPFDPNGLLQKIIKSVGEGVRRERP